MTTEVEPLIHPEAQFQNPAPIKPQSPIPAGVHDMEISWDRNEGYMRVIIGMKKWWFKELLGKAQILGVTSKGRMNVRAIGVLTGEQLVLYRDPDAELHSKVKGISYPASYQRCCFRRNPPAGQAPDWRVRDERKTKQGDLSAIRFVGGYVGDWNIEWPAQDPVAHVFHSGPWTECAVGCFMHPKGGFAHFYES